MVKEISTSIWSVQHPKAGQNIQKDSIGLEGKRGGVNFGNKKTGLNLLVLLSSELVFQQNKPMS